MLAGNKAFAIIFGDRRSGAVYDHMHALRSSGLAVGRREYSSIYDFSTPSQRAGVALSCDKGFIYDHTESCDLVIIFAVVAVVILVLTILAMNKSKGTAHDGRINYACAGDGRPCICC